jgi:hypothetical protein
MATEKPDGLNDERQNTSADVLALLFADLERPQTQNEHD